MRIRTILGATALSLLLMTSPAYAEVEVGAEGPDVTGDGYFNTDPVKMSDLKGRLILLELFGTR